MQDERPHQMRDDPEDMSQLSHINALYKQQFYFLQKFFRSLLNDFFADSLTNVYEEYFYEEPLHRNLYQLVSQLYITRHPFTPQLFELKINELLSKRSRTLQDLSLAFRLLYPQTEVRQVEIMSDEMLLVDVKVRYERNKLQNLPSVLIKEIVKAQAIRQPADNRVLQWLEEQARRLKCVNVIIVYFGDTNFNQFDQSQFTGQSINIAGKTLPARFFVYYVSRIALIDTFNYICKRDYSEGLKQITMQIYQQKRKHRKMKKIKIEKDKQKKQWSKTIFIGIVGVGVVLIFISMYYFAQKKN